MRDDCTFAIAWTESDADAPGTADVYLRSFDAYGNALQVKKSWSTANTRPATRCTRP